MADTLTSDIRTLSGFQVCSENDAKINADVFREYDSARLPRYADMVENDNFYHGEQFTEEQERAIVAFSQSPLSINVTYSIIKQMISLLTSERPTWDVDPVSDADKNVAYLMRELLNATWYISRADRHLEQAIKSALITGVGYTAINPIILDGRFFVDFRYVPYHDVYVSPNARDFLFTDAENIVISKYVSLKQAATILDLSLKEVEEIGVSATEEFDVGSDVTRPRIRYQTSLEGHKSVRIIQRLTLERTKFYVVRPAIGVSAGLMSRRIYFELPESVIRAKASGLVTVDEVEADILAKYISLGRYCQKYYIPITSYNIVPYTSEFNGTPYALSPVDFLRPLQKALNKFVMLAIMNGLLTNGSKVIAPANTIDKDYFEQNWSLPSALIEYQWREGMPSPQIINPPSLPAQFFEMPRMMIQIMEYITGIFGIVQGNPQGAPRTASGLISLQNFGGQKVRSIGRNIEDSLSHAGDIAIQLWQNYAPYNGSIAYRNPDKNDFVSIKYNTINTSGTGSLLVENDLSAGRYHVRCLIRPNYGSEREAKLNILTNLAAQTRSTVLIKPILKLADIPELDEVLRALDEMAQAKATIEQLQGQVKRLSDINNQLQNQIIRKSQQVEISEFRSRLESLRNKLAGAARAELDNLLAQVQPTNGQG
ncbi:MAG: hypothetical protein QW194_04230 [Candidatus Micrarchaeaceae archaeon]